MIDGDTLSERVVGEEQTVAQHLGCDVEDVLRHEVAAAAHESQRPSRCQQPERGPGAGPSATSGARSGSPQLAGTRVAITSRTA